MEELVELTRHGSFSLVVAFVVSAISYLVWRVLLPGVETAWLVGPLAILLVMIACLPNGMHWLLDIRHVDLAADSQKHPLPYSTLFIADVIGTLCGALAGVLLGRRVKGGR